MNIRHRSRPVSLGIAAAILSLVAVACGPGEADRTPVVPTLDTDSPSDVDASKKGDGESTETGYDAVDGSSDTAPVAVDGTSDTGADGENGIPAPDTLSPDSGAEETDTTSDADSSGIGRVIGTFRTDTPCPGCYTYAPESAAGSPAPLVVALHGDEGNADLIANTFRSPVRDHGAVLLALECPRSLGCSGKWWKWEAGKKQRGRQWIDRQIDAVVQTYDIDRKQVHMTGWSGGATYMPRYVIRRTNPLAAVAFVSGGAKIQADCPNCKTPAKIIVGSEDYLLQNARATRDYFQNCDHSVDFQLLEGKGHNLAPWMQSGGANSVVEWLLAHPDSCGTW